MTSELTTTFSVRGRDAERVKGSMRGGEAPKGKTDRSMFRGIAGNKGPGTAPQRKAAEWIVGGHHLEPSDMGVRVSAEGARVREIESIGARMGRTDSLRTNCAKGDVPYMKRGGCGE